MAAVSGQQGGASSSSSSSSTGGGSSGATTSSSGGGGGGGSCAAPVATPPAAFFEALARLHPEDRTWTWNPWDTPPLNGDRAPAVERLLCADFEFVHPGTIAAPEHARALPRVLADGPPAAKAALRSLIDWAAADLAKPPAAKAAVFVAYNPAPWDKARFTPAMKADAESLARDAAAAASAGAAGHGEFASGDAPRALNHTLAWLATGRAAHAAKAVEILDAWCAHLPARSTRPPPAHLRIRTHPPPCMHPPPLSRTTTPTQNRATTTRSFGPLWANGPLEAAWALASMARAAELLKHMGAAAWSRGVERRFFAFVDALLLPNLRYYDAVGAREGGRVVF